MRIWAHDRDSTILMKHWCFYIYSSVYIVLLTAIVATAAVDVVVIVVGLLVLSLSLYVCVCARACVYTLTLCVHTHWNANICICLCFAICFLNFLFLLVLHWLLFVCWIGCSNACHNIRERQNEKNPYSEHRFSPYRQISRLTTCVLLCVYNTCWENVDANVNLWIIWKQILMTNNNNAFDLNKQKCVAVFCYFSSCLTKGVNSITNIIHIDR